MRYPVRYSLSPAPKKKPKNRIDSPVEKEREESDGGVAVTTDRSSNYRKSSYRFGSSLLSRSSRRHASVQKRVSRNKLPEDDSRRLCDLIRSRRKRERDEKKTRGKIKKSHVDHATAAFVHSRSGHEGWEIMQSP